MDQGWLSFLRCPDTRSPYDVDATREAGDDLIEAFLVSREGRSLRLVLAGLAILPPDLPAHLRDYGHVYGRIPLADSRVARFVLGRAGSGNDDFVPFDEVVARYGDLADPGVAPEVPPPAGTDASLARMLGEHVSRGARGLDVGCGVGRGVFVLRQVLDAVLGVDRSAARVRRARNIAVTDAHFFIRAPEGASVKEIPLELTRLERRGVDFAVADAEALPLADGCIDVVVLRDGDGRGAWPDAATALRESCRVLAPAGLLLTELEPDLRTEPLHPVGRDGRWIAWRRP